MAGSFGMETPQGEHRYRLSFTVGGLLATQGRTLAEMYLKHVSDSGGQPDPNRENREIGEAITMIRAQAIEENVLAIRTVTASKRIVAETLKRLSVFTSGGAPARMTPIERLAAKADGKRKELLDNQRGVTYYRLFGPYLAGASRILVKDAYVRVPYQLRNFAEFLETALRCKDPDKDVVEVHLVTGRNDPEYRTAQMDGLEQLQSAYSQYGVNLTFEFSDTLHDRSIASDTGWLILPGRGLDIFQKFDDGNWLNPLIRNQQLRRVRECTIAYQRIDEK